MRVAVGQIAPRFGDVERSLERCLAALAQAARERCDLLVLPECALSGYMFASAAEAVRAAQPVPGPAIDELVRACGELGLYCSLGLLELAEEALHNSVVLVGPQGLVGRYRKAHLPVLGADRFATAGDEAPPVWATAAAGIGVVVCYDLLFPELTRSLALRGADVVAVSTNWHGSRCERVAFLTRTRAFENRVFLVLANRVGDERGARFCGRSQVVSPDGGVLAEAGADEELLVAELEIEQARAKDIVNVPGEDELHLFADRRPELYEALRAPPRAGAGDSPRVEEARRERVLGGRVVSLHVAPGAGQPTRALLAVCALPGRGLAGDRYFLGTGFYSDKPGPDRELTLIELETIEALRREHGIVLDPGEARRNVVTEGVPLNQLVRREFRIGEVLARGIRLCEPCIHLVEVTGREVLAPLVHRGGLRAQLLSAGWIRVGDPVHGTLEADSTDDEPQTERRASPAAPSSC